MNLWLLPKMNKLNKQKTNKQTNKQTNHKQIYLAQSIFLFPKRKWVIWSHFMRMECLRFLWLISFQLISFVILWNFKYKPMASTLLQTFLDELIRFVEVGIRFGRFVMTVHSFQKCTLLIHRTSFSTGLEDSNTWMNE